MANIKINNLNATGADFFTDQESFLSELSDAEMGMQGGFFKDFILTITTLTFRTTTIGPCI